MVWHMTPTETKPQHPRTRELRLRRVAAREGLTLSKIRRHDPRAADYGNYRLYRVDGSDAIPTGRAGLTLDAVEAHLYRP